jgi:hypothetical protein
MAVGLAFHSFKGPFPFLHYRMVAPPISSIDSSRCLPRLRVVAHSSHFRLNSAVRRPGFPGLTIIRPLPFFVRKKVISVKVSL